MITRKINKINHPIYSSIDEFRKDNPNLLLVNNWREGTEGSWVVSDDGQVCEVLKRGTMLRRAGSKQKNYYIRVPLGTFICGDNIKMEGEPRRNLYSFGLTDTSVYEHKVEKKKTTQREFLFAQYVAKGEDVVDAFVKAFPTNNKSYAEGQAKRIKVSSRLTFHFNIITAYKRSERNPNVIVFLLTPCSSEHCPTVQNLTNLSVV